MSVNEKNGGGPPSDAPWPAPRLKALQVDELYKYAPTAAGYSYFGALLTLGVLITAGDIGRGAVWFVWATAVTFFRCVCIVAYRRRSPDSDPEAWGRLMVAGNFPPGVQWGLLGPPLFPREPGYLIALAATLNQKLERENRDLAHRVAVRGASAQSARGRAERLEMLFERSPLPQIECDSAGVVLTCNPAAERLFGLPHDELTGRPLTMLLAIPGNEVRQLAFAEHGESFDVEARARDGLRVACIASFTPLPEIDGRRPGSASSSPASPSPSSDTVK